MFDLPAQESPMAHKTETVKCSSVTRTTPVPMPGLKLKTRVRAGDGAGQGGPVLNHNTSLVRVR
jgi:hypothetical protein